MNYTGFGDTTLMLIKTTTLHVLVKYDYFYFYFLEVSHKVVKNVEVEIYIDLCVDFFHEMDKGWIHGASFTSPKKGFEDLLTRLLFIRFEKIHECSYAFLHYHQERC